MYAVIESGGKQYHVELGSEIQVDRLAVQPGDSITLDRVLLVADGDEAAIGRPLVEGATVRADVLGQDRGKKVVVFKYRPKARRRVKKGFRAELTTLRISEIWYAGRSAASEAETQATREEEAARAAAEAAARKAAADQALAARLATTPEAATPEPAAPGVARPASRSRTKVAAGAVEPGEPEAPQAEPAVETGAAQEPQAAQDPEPAADEGTQTDETDGGEAAAEAAAGDARKDG